MVCNIYKPNSLRNTKYIKLMLLPQDKITIIHHYAKLSDNVNVSFSSSQQLEILHSFVNR